MPCEQLEHVVEEPDARSDVVAAPAVERQPDRDRCLRGLPFDHATPHRTSSSAANARSVCSTTPVVIRMQPGHAGSRDLSRTCTPRDGQPLDNRARHESPNCARTKLASLGQKPMPELAPARHRGAPSTLAPGRDTTCSSPCRQAPAGSATDGADVEAERRHDAPERHERRRHCR